MGLLEIHNSEGALSQVLNAHHITDIYRGREGKTLITMINVETEGYITVNVTLEDVLEAWALALAGNGGWAIQEAKSGL